MQRSAENVSFCAFMMISPFRFFLKNKKIAIKSPRFDSNWLTGNAAPIALRPYLAIGLLFYLLNIIIHYDSKVKQF